MRGGVSFFFVLLLLLLKLSGGSSTMSYIAVGLDEQPDKRCKLVTRRAPRKQLSVPFGEWAIKSGRGSSWRQQTSTPSFVYSSSLVHDDFGRQEQQQQQRDGASQRDGTRATFLVGSNKNNNNKKGGSTRGGGSCVSSFLFAVGR